MATEVVLMPDQELERLAREHGAGSVEAMVLARLRYMRAKDRQVFAFRVGDYFLTGPLPDARSEVRMLDLAEEEDDAGKG
jgi:hypothetical protein